MTIIEKWRLMLASFADIKAAISEREIGVSSGYKHYANAVRGIYSGANVSECEYPQSTGDTASDAVNLVRWCGIVKEQIRLAIVGGGVVCNKTVPLSEYGNKIRQISTLKITTTRAAIGEAGKACSYQLQAEGGKPPYTWKYVSGGYPSGITLNSDGVISGIPKGSGTYLHYEVKCTDSAGASAIKEIKLVVTAQ